MLFPTALRVAAAAKLVILGILSLTSFISALKAGVIASISLILDHFMHIFNSVFIDCITLFFLNQQKQVLTYQHLIQLIDQYLIYQPLILS